MVRSTASASAGCCSPQAPLDMGNSGTSTRLLMGLVASHPITAQFTGDASLSKRPMGRVTEPLGLMGADFIRARRHPAADRCAASAPRCRSPTACRSPARR